MQQLVLPFEELLADEMERALDPYVGWDVGWWDFSSYANHVLQNSEISTYHEQIIDQWDDGLSLMERYNVERLKARCYHKPWTQLWLPLYGSQSYIDGDAAIGQAAARSWARRLTSKQGFASELRIRMRDELFPLTKVRLC